MRYKVYCQERSVQLSLTMNNLTNERSEYYLAYQLEVKMANQLTEIRPYVPARAVQSEYPVSLVLPYQGDLTNNPPAHRLRSVCRQLVLAKL